MTSGIGELRKAVALFNNCHEAFNEGFTALQLIRLWRVFKACGWDIPPDKWSDQQVSDALLSGKIPEWDDNEKPVYR